MRKLILLTVVLLCFLTCGQQKAVPAFDQLLQSFTDDPVLNPASWSFSAHRHSDSQTLVSVNSHVSVIPASTMKLLTTAAAWQLLGDDYRFETHLLHNGDVDDTGTLNGDIIIRGFGDPSLGSSRWFSTRPNSVFSEWAAILKSKGISSVNGNIIGDASRWDVNIVNRDWQYEDFGNYYAGGSGGLNFAENTLQLFFTPSGRIGSPAKLVRTSPDIGGISFINQVVTGAAGSGDKVIVYGGPYSNPRILQGSVPAGQAEFLVRASMPDPALGCAFLFKSYLEKNGCQVNGSAKSVIPGFNELKYSKEELLHITKSPSLRSIIKITNQNSNNLFAESLFKALGYKISGQGNYTAAQNVVKEFMQPKGVAETGLNIVDGCGLSRTNLVTSGLMVRLLVLMSEEKGFDDFFQSLPLAGSEGTVRHFLRNRPPSYEFRVKSGYIRNVRSYAGYVSNSEGEMISFAIIINNFNCTPAVMRQKIEPLLYGLTEFL